MRKALNLVILGSLLALFAGPVNAIGFGRIGGSTTLGQQLNFSALVRLEADEQLASECVSAEVLSGENKLAAGAVRVGLEPAASPSERLVRVTTSVLLDEPVVTVTLSVGCASRLSRKFVVFLDPPFINLAQSGATELPPPPPPAPPRAAASAPAKPDDVSGREAVTPAPARPAPRVVRPLPRPKALVVSPNAAAAAQAARARKQKADQLDAANNRVVPTGPRLKLEAPVVNPGVRASEPSATPLAGVANAASAASAESAVPQAAASAAADEQSQLIAKERERLKALEDSLNRLRAETEATQKTLLSLQSRLKGAESERFSNSLVYGLAALCGALLLAVAAMWRRHSLREAAWWASPQHEAAVTVAPTESPPAPPVPAAAAGRAPTRPEPASGTLPSRPVVAALVSAPDTLPPTVHPEPQATTPRRELSVEELIDLEQQAEFFVVLGQDDAAIDLLMGHLRSTGGSSPLPYLKLLEIYRRQGDSEAYNRTRERFNRRFNAYAPDWDSDLQQGRSLEAYPDVIERLQSIWSKPPQVIEMLDAALFRRDQSEDTFDVPAYRELVLLYSVIRDIAESDGSGAVVDLLLPIDPAAEQAKPQHFHTALAPLVSVTELSAADRRIPTLDLDISAVRVFERPVDIETPDLRLGSQFLGLVDEPAPSGDRRKT